jgi:energy-converting hydrogenase Eha subunit F
MKPTAVRFDVRVHGEEIIVTLADFCAIYVKPLAQPHLMSAAVALIALVGLSANQCTNEQQQSQPSPPPEQTPQQRTPPQQ